MQSFVGLGTPLTAAGFTGTTGFIGTGAAELWTVLAVETSGCGFLPDRRPKILFERHIFSALTRHAYDDTHPDISQPTPGGYGAGGANQYIRLAEALVLDESSALQSASWGLGQVMGMNFHAAGYHDVGTMVGDMILSEDRQLAAMAAFLRTHLLSKPLATHDWAVFARGYNGASYAAHNYDGHLAHFYGIYAAGNQPDIDVRHAQMGLAYLDYTPGPVDGLMGRNTAGAVEAFQTAQDIRVTGAVDATLLGALDSAVAALPPK